MLRMRQAFLAAIIVAVGCGGSAAKKPGGSGDGGNIVTTSGGGTVSGTEIFPSDNPWNEDISSADVDPDSATYIKNMNPTKGLHADFSNIVDGNYGIPYVIVASGQAEEPVTFTAYGDQSDPGPYPIPLDAPIEGMGQGDAHVIGVDTAHHMLYELYGASTTSKGWDAQCGAKFDLSSDALRTEGWTSADAAGLPIFPGLARADEAITDGEIKHALRFTVSKSQAGYVSPARHFAGDKNASLPPMGLRLRLKASVDISAAGPQAKAILQALKTYGMFVADNGSDWYISGSPDERWDDDDLHTLGKITGNDFEVIKHGPIGTLSP
jgi:hypothetical protein